MTESFAHKRQMSESHFQNALHQGGDETTPSIISTAVVAFATELGGAAQFVPVINDQCGLFGWCSDGVEEKVRNEGGKISFGWSIWEWPNILLTAEFHSVWEDTGRFTFRYYSEASERNTHCVCCRRVLPAGLRLRQKTAKSSSPHPP
jgi:hypothetical protein